MWQGGTHGHRVLLHGLGQVRGWGQLLLVTPSRINSPHQSFVPINLLSLFTVQALPLPSFPVPLYILLLDPRASYWPALFPVGVFCIREKTCIFPSFSAGRQRPLPVYTQLLKVGPRTSGRAAVKAPHRWGWTISVSLAGPPLAGWKGSPADSRQAGGMGLFLSFLLSGAVTVIGPWHYLGLPQALWCRRCQRDHIAM